VFFHAPFLASPRTHPLHITSAKGSQMHESKTAPINQNIVLTMSEIISDDAKKTATRGDVMVLAVTTEAEFSKLRSWISARFDKVDADFAKVDARFDKMSSENTHNTNQLLRRNTAQVLSIAISAFGVVAALVANIIF
jgi:hypothetical protein